jgi:hypothetical protein
MIIACRHSRSSSRIRSSAMSSYPTLVELADHVGADLARGRGDGGKVAAAGRSESLNKATSFGPVHHLLLRHVLDLMLG